MWLNLGTPARGRHLNQNPAVAPADAEASLLTYLLAWLGTEPGLSTPKLEAPPKAKHGS